MSLQFGAVFPGLFPVGHVIIPVTKGEITSKVCGKDNDENEKRYIYNTKL